ncbi:ATP-binding cassette domain-containing protein [Parahaliea aestuarii]|uniref:ATP-binding cassette domain-containing protein n=1 Tax=Parahaliea aestuarii TaxID=1852021 RepID=A0A5C8ZP11_9GAMM|nr:ATP-binding cassette domain-containing protein [Parahaliea aestuarii]TXS89460.1 ATP-binding cassette domain-containing protein [Parahaliea aestuarii]
MNPETLLSLHHLSLVYRALPVLHELDWRFERGQQWACIGPNGAGKTSLARVLSGQAGHFSGEYCRGKALRDSGVAYVCFEQARALCERDKKLDDSEFRADASDPGTRVQDFILGKGQPDAVFQHWVERLRMGHILQRGLRYISTGEMRKTLLLAAILSEPGLLILDSPLDGLDTRAQAELARVIDDLLVSGLPLLLLCRSLGDVPPGITHLLVLERGEVLDSGPREAVEGNTSVQNLMNPPLPPLGDLPPVAERSYSLPAEGPLLALRNVSVRYGETVVLENLDWTFERHQHCCIAGPNGCGKTTLLSLITGDNHKAYGQDITLFGLRRGSGESVWDIKQKYGLLDTQLQLNFKQRMGVMEVVISGFFDSLGLYDDFGDQQRQRAEAWLRALGMGSYLRERFDTLSFGLQRMVLLARAMVKSPAILILDEPTLGLDSHHRSLMLRAIDHIAEYSDTRIIFVSHSAGDTPGCINQFLTFEPDGEAYRVICNNRD